MNLTDNEVLKFQRGSPVWLEDICPIYPATLGEIVDIGYDNFQQYLSVLTITKPTEVKDNQELQQIIATITDFQYLLLVTSVDPQLFELFLNGAKFFLHADNVRFSLEPAQIVLFYGEEEKVLDEEHFYELQRILRRMYFLEQEGEEIIISPDDDPMTRHIKMQMRANREKVRKAKAAKAAREKSDLKLSDLIGSMTINDCGLNMVNIWDITYYAFHDQLKRMGWRDQFNINQKAALAGAKINKSQLKHWMRSIVDDK